MTTPPEPPPSGAETVTCPLDGALLTMDTFEDVDYGTCRAVVRTAPGTAHAHMRDAHPEHWQEMCEFQRKWNATGMGMARRVDGCFLPPDGDVGDL
jgi:hypothetical protein